MAATTIKRKSVLLLLMLALMAVGVRAQVSDSESVTMKASIEAIDKTARTITLKGPRGNLVMVHAAETVKRFDQLKVGVITATITVAVAARIRKAGDPEPKSKASSEILKDKIGAKDYSEETITVSGFEFLSRFDVVFAAYFRRQDDLALRGNGGSHGW